MTLLLEYSTKGEQLDDLEFNVILVLFVDQQITAPKYVHATAEPISATSVEKDRSAAQRVNVTVVLFFECRLS